MHVYIQQQPGRCRSGDAGVNVGANVGVAGEGCAAGSSEGGGSARRARASRWRVRQGWVSEAARPGLGAARARGRGKGRHHPQAGGGTIQVPTGMFWENGWQTRPSQHPVGVEIQVQLPPTGWHVGATPHTPESRHVSPLVQQGRPPSVQARPVGTQLHGVMGMGAGGQVGPGAAARRLVWGFGRRPGQGGARRALATATTARPRSARAVLCHRRRRSRGLRAAHARAQAGVEVVAAGQAAAGAGVAGCHAAAGIEGGCGVRASSQAGGEGWQAVQQRLAGAPGQSWALVHTAAPAHVGGQGPMATGAAAAPTGEVPTALVKRALTVQLLPHSGGTTPPAGVQGVAGGGGCAGGSASSGRRHGG